MQTLTPIDIAIKAAGTQQRLADALGIKSASISGWKKAGRIPAERVPAVEAATRVPRHVLRADLYAAPQLANHNPPANPASGEHRTSHSDQDRHVRRGASR